ERDVSVSGPHAAEYGYPFDTSFVGNGGFSSIFLHQVRDSAKIRYRLYSYKERPIRNLCTTLYPRRSESHSRSAFIDEPTLLGSEGRRRNIARECSGSHTASTRISPLEAAD